MKELSVLLLLLLASASEGVPLQRTRRTIHLKDYFNPLTYPTDKVHFEKGEDGKYHAEPASSAVEYAIASAKDAKNEISDSTSEEEKVDLSKLNGHDISIKVLAADKDKTEVKEAAKVPKPETTAKLDSEKKKPDNEEAKIETSAKLDIPLDSKWTLVPKPDGKDEDVGDDYIPEPPIAPPADDEGKIAIGQIPKHHHPIYVRPNIPLLMVPKSILFLMSKHPAMDISDRLPLPEVFEESEETVKVEHVSLDGQPTVVNGEKRFISNHPLFNPLRIGLQLPFAKDDDDEEKIKGLPKSEVVDVAGRKMLLQRKVLLSPHHHRLYISVQPLDGVEPEISKEIDEKKKEIESEETRLKFDEKRSLKDDEIHHVRRKTEVPSETATSDAKKTEVDAKVSPPEFPAVERAEKEEHKDFELETKMKDEAARKAKEGHTVETKLKDETAHEAKEGHNMETKLKGEAVHEANEESGLKIETQPGIHFRGDVEEDKGTTIPIVVTEEKKGEAKNVAVAKEEKDVLIGTEDLQTIRSQVKSQTPSSIDLLNKRIKADEMRGEYVLENEGHTKDEEVAQSQIVEVTLRPAEEFKDSLEEGMIHGKKGIFNTQGGSLSHSGVEYKAGKESKEHVVIEPKDLEIDTASNSGFEYKASKESKEHVVIEPKDLEKDTASNSGVEYKVSEENKEHAGIEPKDLEKVLTERKKGDEGLLSVGEVAATHSGVEYITSKNDKEHSDIPTIGPKDIEKVINEETLKTEEVAAPHSEAEFRAYKDAKELTDSLHSEHKDMKVIAESKKGDEGILSVEKVAATHSGVEYITSKDDKEHSDIPTIGPKDIEKVINEETLKTKEVATPHSEAEFRANKDAKELTDSLHSEHKDMKVIAESKKGDEGILSVEKVAAPHSGVEYITSKDDKEHSDIPTIGPKDIEKAINEETLKTEEVAASHSEAEFRANKDAKELTDSLHSEHKDMKVIAESKKGDEGILSVEKIAAPHSGVEYRTSKNSKELPDELNVKPKDIEKVLTEEKKGVLNSEEFAGNESKDSKEITDTEHAEHKETEIMTDAEEEDDVEEVEPSHKETELREIKETKEQIDALKDESKDLDKVVTEGEEEKSFASRKGAEITEGKDTEEKADITKIDSKQLHEESKTEGDDETSSAERAVVTHVSTEIAPSKGAKGKFDVRNLQHSEEDDETSSTERAVVTHVSTEIAPSKVAKGKFDVRNLQHSEEGNPKTEDFGLKTTEGALLEERKKKIELRKEKETSKKSKCNCEESMDSEESDDSDTDDED